MSQLVKTKRQANFKDVMRFEAFKRLVEQKKNLLFCLFIHQEGKHKNNRARAKKKFGKR
jgi:hypothetical protein